MENIITIGGKVDKETADNLKDYMIGIFKAGKEFGMDQSTVVEAIHAVSKVATADHATITNSHFIGEKNIYLIFVATLFGTDKAIFTLFILLRSMYSNRVNRFGKLFSS